MKGVSPDWTVEKGVAPRYGSLPHLGNEKRQLISAGAPCALVHTEPSHFVDFHLLFARPKSQGRLLMSPLSADTETSRFRRKLNSSVALHPWNQKLENKIK